MIGLLLAKTIVWAVSLSSGTSGGVLAPLLIIGGSLGALVGQCLPIGNPGLWAMVGMGAMIGGTMRSPLTGVIFTIELSHDFSVMPALFVASVAAFGTTVLVLRRSILTEKLARRGQHVAREYSVDIFELVLVADAMDSQVPTVPAGMTVRELSDRIAQGEPLLSRRQGKLILDGNHKLAGIITNGDLIRATQAAPAGDLSVLEAGKTELIVTYPDESLHDAAAKMFRHGVGRLPVVKRNEPDQAVGD